MGRSTESRAPQFSVFEHGARIAGVLLIVAGVVAAFLGQDVGGLARAFGSSGIAAVLAYAASRGLRLYRAGLTASLPTSVARVQVRIRPARTFNACAVSLALGVPLAGGLVLLALVSWAWLPLSGVLLLGCIAIAVARGEDVWGEPYALPAPVASELLQRLCMRADMRAPELIAEHDATANCWTEAGRIHVTAPLLRLLDKSELEAVLAHEVAHLAHRDSSVMEICSAPSRVLLTFAGSFTRGLPRVMKELASHGMGGLMTATVLMALCIPPAFVVGWICRLSVLGMSRAREFSADAAAAALTGRPSALASALLKLEGQSAPSSDLRRLEADAVLCIVGTRRSQLGRLLATHPPTAARVKRLEETEGRIQAASGPGRLWAGT